MLVIALMIIGYLLYKLALQEGAKEATEKFNQEEAAKMAYYRAYGDLDLYNSDDYKRAMKRYEESQKCRAKNSK